MFFFWGVIYMVILPIAIFGDYRSLSCDAIRKSLLNWGGSPADGAGPTIPGHQCGWSNYVFFSVLSRTNIWMVVYWITIIMSSLNCWVSLFWLSLQWISKVFVQDLAWHFLVSLGREVRSARTVWFGWKIDGKWTCHVVTSRGKTGSWPWKITMFERSINYKWPCSRRVTGAEPGDHPQSRSLDRIP